MKPNKDVTVFELVTKPSSTYKDRNGQPKRSTGQLSLKATATILFEDEDGDTWEREIRYMPSKRSIFVDEQDETIPDAQQELVWKMVEKPQFVGGYLYVESTQKNLLNFLRTHPENEANAHLRTNSKVRDVFRERNPVAIAQKQNAETKKQMHAERLIFEADYESKIKPIAMYLNIDTDDDPEIVRWYVKDYAVKNPDEFLDLMDNYAPQRYYMIGKAVKLGILKIDGQRILWVDGRQIVDVPTSHEPIKYLAEASFDDKYRTTWAEIERLLDKRTNPKKDAETIAEAAPTDESLFEDIDADALFVALKEGDIIKWKPPYFYLGEERLGQGQAATVDIIRNDIKRFASLLKD